MKNILDENRQKPSTVQGFKGMNSSSLSVGMLRERDECRGVGTWDF